MQRCLTGHMHPRVGALEQMQALIWECSRICWTESAHPRGHSYQEHSVAHLASNNSIPCLPQPQHSSLAGKAQLHQQTAGTRAPDGKMAPCIDGAAGHPDSVYL